MSKRLIARICAFLRGSHAAERLFLRGAFACLGFFFLYVCVAGHWSALFAIALCALGYKANVGPTPVRYTMAGGHVSVTYDAGPVVVTLPRPHAPRALSPLPVIAGSPYANMAAHPWSDDKTTDTAVRS